MKEFIRFARWILSGLAGGNNSNVGRVVATLKLSPRQRRLLALVAAVGAAFLASNSTLAQTWQSLGFHPDPSTLGLNVVASSTNGATVIMAGAGDFATSTNGGASWIDANPPVANGWAAVVCSADGSKIFANGVSFIAVSTDGGATWAQSDPSGVVWSDTVGSIACSADGNTLLAATGFGATIGGSIFVSTNAGLSWNQTTSPTQFWSGVACSADGTRMAAAAPASTMAGVLRGGIYTSIDAGASWTEANVPTNNWYSVASSADGVRLVAAGGYTKVLGSGYDSILISRNSGLNWGPASFPVNERWTQVVSSADGSRLAVEGDSQSGEPSPIMVSTDSGLNWNEYDTSLSTALDSPAALAMSANGTSLLAVTSSGDAVYTLDLGPPAPPQILGITGSQTVQLVYGKPQATGWTVAVVGTPPLSYQWLLDGMNLPGATNANYSIPAIDLTNGGGYQALISNLFGSVTSVVSALVVLAPLPSVPVVTGSNYQTTIPPGGSSSFSVTVAGAEPFVYQWLLDGAILPDQTNASVTITNVQSAGDCQVTVSNSLGGLVLDFRFTLQQAPQIVGPPQNQAVYPGGTAVFTVDVVGVGPFSYQWTIGSLMTLDLRNLPGATNATLVLPVFQNYGEYGVVVSNPYGTATSGVYSLTYSPNPPIPIMVPPQVPAEAGGLLQLSGSSLAGQMYKLQSTTDLSLTNWAFLGAQFAATGDVSSILIAPATNSLRFYRVVLLR